MDGIALTTASSLHPMKVQDYRRGEGLPRGVVTQSSGGCVATCAVGSRALLVLVGGVGLNRGLPSRASRPAAGHLEHLLAGACVRASAVAVGKAETGEIAL